MIVTRQFKGINTYTPQGDLQAGELRQADNCFIEATELVSRPGFVGLLSSPHAGDPIYGPMPYLKGDGSTAVVYSAGGKIFQWLKGNTSDTEILNADGSVSFSVNSAGFQQARLGVYDYMVDGTHGLIRTSLASSVAEFVTGLNAPALTGLAPTASLADSVIDTPTVSEWIPAPAPNNVLQSYTDLTVDATTNTEVTSAGHPFGSSNAGQQINITSGLTPGLYVIESVSGVKATLNHSPGSVGSSGGVGTLTYGIFGLIANGNFSIGGGGSSIPDVEAVGAPWTLVNGPYGGADTPDYGSNSGSGSSEVEFDGNPWSLLLDNPFDSVGQSFTPPPLETTAFPGLNGLTKSYIFNFTCKGQLQIAGSNASLAVTIRALDSSNDTLASITQVLTPGSGATTLQGCFSFGALTADPDHYVLVLSSGPNNVGSSGVWVGSCSLNAVQNGPVLAASGTNQVQWSAPYTAVTGTYVVRDYGSGGMSFGNVGILSIPAFTPLNASHLFLQVGFVETGGAATINWTNPVAFTSDGTHAYVDITTVDPAVLASVRYLYIEFTADLQVTDSPVSIWTFGPLTNAGNLSVSSLAGGVQYSPVYYAYTEISDADNGPYAPQLVNIVESDPSNNSGAITPSPAQATADVVLPTPVNAATTWYAVYRGGGVFSDGLLRLIATVPVGSDVAMSGDSLNRDLSNPYYSWDHTTRTLVDDTPDMFLFNSNILQYGREMPPTGAQCVCAWQNRLWLAVGSTLYGSWNVVADEEAGLYYTTSDISTDPELALKGITVGIGAADDDVIQALMPVGSYLFIMKQYSVWVLSGYDPTNFSLQQFLSRNGVGLVAARAVSATASPGPAYTPLGISFNHVVFLGADGLYAFDGSNAVPSSIQLEKTLNVKDDDGNVLIGAEAMAASAMVLWDRRIYVMAPAGFSYFDLAIDASNYEKVTSASRPFVSSDIGGTVSILGGDGFTAGIYTVESVSGGAAVLSAAAGTVGSTDGIANFGAARNTVMYVFDTRVGGWTRYLVGATSGAALTASSDTNDIYFGGYDGQLYTLMGTLDKTGPSDGGSAVTMSVTTRGFGQEADGSSFFARTRPTRVYLDLVSPAGGAAWSVSVAGDDPAKTFTKEYTAQAGASAVRIKTTPSSDGLTVSVGVSATVSGQARIRAIGVEAAKGTIAG